MVVVGVEEGVRAEGERPEIVEVAKAAEDRRAGERGGGERRGRRVPQPSARGARGRCAGGDASGVRAHDEPRTAPRARGPAATAFSDQVPPPPLCLKRRETETPHLRLCRFRRGAIRKSLGLAPSAGRQRREPQGGVRGSYGTGMKLTTDAGSVPAVQACPGTSRGTFAILSIFVRSTRASQVGPAPAPAFASNAIASPLLGLW